MLPMPSGSGTSATKLRIGFRYRPNLDFSIQVLELVIGTKPGLGGLVLASA